MSETKELLPHFYMKHAGREYKVFKRKAKRDAPYYVCVERRGVRYRRCLEVAIQDQAEKRAREVIDLVLNDNVTELQAKKLRGAVKPIEPAAIATIGQVLTAYENVAAVFLRQSTIRNNVNCFKLMLRTVHETKDPESLSAEVLDGGLVAKWEKIRLAAAGESEQARQSALVSINGYVRFARSIFKEKFRKAYVRDLGLVLPDLSEFLNEELHAPARQVKEAAPVELVADTFKAAADLKAKDRPAYVAFLLGVCSLRRGEIGRARGSWLNPLPDGRWAIRIPRESKSKVIRLVPVPRAVADELGLDRLGPEDYLVPRPGQSAGEVFRRVNKFMRDCGWTTRHTLHEMRAYYLRLVRDQFGLSSAAEVAGHGDLRTTRNNYTGVLDVSALDVQLPMISREGAKEAKV